MKKLLIGLSLILLVPVMTNAETKSYKDTEAESEFLEADIIADGKVDAGEHDIYAIRNFMKLDTDGDRFITPDECLRDCFKAKQQVIDGVMQGQFDTIDMDGDGYISNFEYLFHQRDRFQKADTNKDGGLSREEFCAVFEPMRPCAYSQLKGAPIRP